MQLGKTLVRYELSDNSDGDEVMSLTDVNEDKDAKIKALVDSGAALIQIEDSEVDENDTLD